MPRYEKAVQEIDHIKSTGGEFDVPRYAVAIDGEDFDRLQILSDGSIVSGDGTSEPLTPVGGGGGSTGTMAGSVVVAELLDDNGGDLVDFTGATITVDDNIAEVGASGLTLNGAGLYTLDTHVLFGHDVPVSATNNYVEVDIASTSATFRNRNKRPAINAGVFDIQGASATGVLAAAALVAVQIGQKTGVTLEGTVTVYFTLTKHS